MSEVDLCAGPWRARLRPDVGGSLASLTFDGTEVLRTMPEGSSSPLDAACFPLAPYCNRIRDGRFTFAGREVILPPNFAPETHSIHGLAWQRPWQVESQAANKCVLVDEYDGADGWPWGYRAEQRVRLGDKGCAITLVLTNRGDERMPAGLGLHPYFRRRDAVRLRFSADHVLLSDPEDGRFRSIIVGNAFSRYKTAADSALGARLLARRAPQTLTIIGAGAQAQTHLRVMAAEFPTLRRIDVWNRTYERAARLADHAAGDAPDADVRAVAHLERSVREADLVVCVTSSTSPVLDGAWLRDGCHVDLVGGYTPSMREANDAALLRSRIYVDHRALVTEHCGDIRQPLDAGVIDAADIEGDLFDLCGGRAAGRRHDTDITLFKNGGGGHLDLMFADWLSRRCATPDDGRMPSDH